VRRRRMSRSGSTTLKGRVTLGFGNMLVPTAGYVPRRARERSDRSVNPLLCAVRIPYEHASTLASDVRAIAQEGKRMAFDCLSRMHHRGAPLPYQTARERPMTQPPPRTQVRTQKHPRVSAQ